MKKLIIAIIFSVFFATNGWATYSGSISGDDGLYGAGIWSDGVLSWNVNVNSNNIWTYNYYFDVENKAISHMIFEVSSTFTAANILPGTTGGYDLGTYSSSNGNPGMPGSVFGLKWDTSGTLTEESITIVTDRAPMWGDFYAKDGVDSGEKIYAYNTQFGSDTLASLGNGNAGGWALVPDTGTGSTPPVPEPGTMLLLGTGLIGLVGVHRKKHKK
ncbi:MAG: PEP-CTERM sorting domain-containing protein [Syntrophales bacterium]|nr:PEP-CTERM sorting domain-containing protein [Syntrophales bacterium]